MVKLLREDVTNREVASWTGIHLFHNSLSSCSQKVRIFLSLKNIDWQSHEIDILGSENLTPRYLGINPRGLVPALVHDGDVHIESNDIMLHIEALYPEPALIPREHGTELVELLALEDSLHMDLRNLTFRFMVPQGVPAKSAAHLEAYAAGGSGRVNGREDERKAVEIAFWRNYSASGIDAAAVRASAAKFRQRLSQLDRILTSQGHILGDRLSLLDIAWFVYVHRLHLVGYPVHALHPHVGRWFDRLHAMPEFARETVMPPALGDAIKAFQDEQRRTGATLAEVCALA